MTIHSLDDITNLSSRYADLIEFDNHHFQVVISTSISRYQSWTKVSVTNSWNAQLNSPYLVSNFREQFRYDYSHNYCLLYRKFHTLKRLITLLEADHSQLFQEKYGEVRKNPSISCFWARKLSNSVLNCVIGINLFLVMCCNSTRTDLFLFVFIQLILHYSHIPNIKLNKLLVSIFLTYSFHRFK